MGPLLKYISKAKMSSKEVYTFSYIHRRGTVFLKNISGNLSAYIQMMHTIFKSLFIYYIFNMEAMSITKPA